MSYTVKELFYTLQGEGIQAGRPAVFLRFSGCNLWTGREEDRAKATCRFCDTDFVGGEKYVDAEAVAAAAARLWPKGGGGFPYVVVTGGEPSLQLDDALILALHRQGFEIGVESNGTHPLPQGIDWICISPKAGTSLVVISGDELKLIYPQDGIDPAQFERLPFRHWLLQPMDGPFRAENTRAALDYCLTHPRWRLSLQQHKILNIP